MNGTQAALWILERLHVSHVIAYIIVTLAALLSGCNIPLPVPESGASAYEIQQAQAFVPGLLTFLPAEAQAKPEPKMADCCEDTEAEKTDDAVAAALVAAQQQIAALQKQNADLLAELKKSQANSDARLDKVVADLKKLSEKPADPPTEQPLQAPVGIDWLTTTVGGHAAAQQNHLPILLHFSGANCAPCRLMETQVFADPTVIEYVNTAVIPVHVDYDTNTDWWQSDWKIYQIPTDVVVSWDWTRRENVTHTTNPRQYIENVKAAVLRLAKKTTSAMESPNQTYYVSEPTYRTYYDVSTSSCMSCGNSSAYYPTTTYYSYPTYSYGGYGGGYYYSGGYGGGCATCR